MKLKRGKLSPATKRARAGKKELMRLYGLPETYQSANLRYQNPIEKGILWYWFSLFIRTRDVKKYGKCISCGRIITVDTCDAGHFMPASSCGNDLLFDETNVNAECSHCNAWDDTHLLGYSEGLDERYDMGCASHLRSTYLLNKSNLVRKNLKPAEYAVKIEHYRNLVSQLT